MESQVKRKHPCPREFCAGSLVLERDDSPCPQCRESGATYCRNCFVELEWRCTLCGRGPRPVRLRRRDLEGDFVAAPPRR